MSVYEAFPLQTRAHNGTPICDSHLLPAIHKSAERWLVLPSPEIPPS